VPQPAGCAGAPRGVSAQRACSARFTTLALRSDTATHVPAAPHAHGRDAERTRLGRTRVRRGGPLYGVTHCQPRRLPRRQRARVHALHAHARGRRQRGRQLGPGGREARQHGARVHVGHARLRGGGARGCGRYTRAGCATISAVGSWHRGRQRAQQLQAAADRGEA
jgi:hypothetical protein